MKASKLITWKQRRQLKKDYNNFKKSIDLARLEPQVSNEVSDD